ncbi:uncharacterized protein BJ212DRAFT_1295868 [Suillus subaureus]|uniref:Uncharacterized protein n=1 Tax=Suillus subaureus TaxID=48587 RepID=A0A9P7EMA9_9AGAM|nr:uncharacterized protein BJ212DRAFT_1295868 [Suillus subaureus]KAG1824783.1 hypothetical protein BJ212DRAFT_1295868 [Suillus subaureus]
MGLAAAGINKGVDAASIIHPCHTQDDIKIGTLPSELEVEALLLSKGKAKPLLEASPRSLTAHAVISEAMLSDLIDVDNDVKVWPGDFYACNIAKGFRLCETISKHCQGVAAVFQKIFRVSYASTTFHAHKKHWADVPAKVMDRFIKAGQTEDGLWLKFMTETWS